MPAAELRDGRVVRHQVRADHPIGHILGTLPLDPPGGPVPPGVRVEQQRHHHLGVIGRPAMAIGAIRPVERAEVHLLHRGKDGPHQMVLGHPLQQRRRHQEGLVPIAGNEVVGHESSERARTTSMSFSRGTHRRASRSGVFATATHQTTIALGWGTVPPVADSDRSAWRTHAVRLSAEYEPLCACVHEYQQVLDRCRSWTLPGRRHQRPRIRRPNGHDPAQAAVQHRRLMGSDRRKHCLPDGSLELPQRCCVGTRRADDRDPHRPDQLDPSVGQRRR